MMNFRHWRIIFKTIIAIPLLTYAFIFLSQDIERKPGELFTVNTDRENLVDMKIKDLEPFNDTLDRLIDLDNFNFVINPAETCDDCKNGTLIIAFIHTALNHADYRTAIRNSWGRSTDCLKFVFVTGVTDNANLTEDIKSESEEYHDMIQGNFLDTYDNLTYKHVAWMKWATLYCPKAKYIVKTDDDIFVNISLLVSKLKNNEFGDRNLIACRLLENPPVLRSNSKWVVSRQEYADDYYPDFCSGPFIVYSADVVPKLLQESYKLPYFRLEDVHVTGILAKRLGYKHIQLIDWYMPSASTLMSLGPDCISPMIFGPMQIAEPDDIVVYWRVVNHEVDLRSGLLVPPLGQCPEPWPILTFFLISVLYFTFSVTSFF